MMWKRIVQGLGVLVVVVAFWAAVLVVNAMRERQARWDAVEADTCSGPDILQCELACLLVQSIRQDPDRRDTPEAMYSIERHVAECDRAIRTRSR